MYKEPYENIYLGNFIYRLGVRSGSQKNRGDVHVHMGQQTPDDRRLMSDLFFGVDGRNYLFEFKRNKSALQAELRKPARRRFLDYLSSVPPDSRPLRLSYRGHFLGIGAECDIMFVPYADGLDMTSAAMRCSKMLSVMLDEPKGKGLNGDDLKTYLQIIGQFTNENFESCGGFIMNFSEAKGLLMVPVVDLLKVVLRLDLNLEESHSESDSKGPSPTP